MKKHKKTLHRKKDEINLSLTEATHIIHHWLSALVRRSVNHHLPPNNQVLGAFCVDGQVNTKRILICTAQADPGLHLCL